MDVPFAADVLDVDLLQSAVPESDRQIAVAALVSGKVCLIDYSDLHRSGSSGTKVGERNHVEDSGRPGHDAAAAGKRKRSVNRSDERNTSRLYSKAWTVKSGSKSCRAARFSVDGTSVFAIAKDMSISRIDVQTGSVLQEWKKAHDAAPSCILPISSTMFATGDDDGVVKMWDARVPTSSLHSGIGNAGSRSSVHSWSHHSDWVTDMMWRSHLRAPMKLRKDSKHKAPPQDEEIPSESRSRLICVGGDGILSVIDPRAGKKGVECSADQEDELLSVRAIKGGDKIVVGTSLGPLSIWAPSKGLLDHVDRLAGHPASVDSLDVLDEDTVLTGSSDGLVRVVQIYPHKLLGVAADHEGFPVERALHAGDWLASIGHENFIRFTSLKDLLDGSEDEGTDEDAEVQGSGDAASSSGASDDSDAEVSKSAKKEARVTATLKQASMPEASSNFFDDL
ncbi:WD40 repeat-like protein [Tilletiaria anomala UBC 951]|uniref:WD repeat-containing protein JIP5 n=1 Tax=Tilletiaria anomala (strain ATCC 24038 / CBS 436.72 / UBC 951) TaxID=1037660 RepID=A0A066WND6_TILAU|nr:WD40 repeat-like protein [Tilletiaria anomala UBC 951]KDN52509.1 WD40 repeat-like protein [Tilletiaria anomala UBC 951]